MAWLSAYVFGPDTKLKINGEFVSYKRYEGDMSDGSDGTMWVLTDLTMTPETGGLTPSEKYTSTSTTTSNENKPNAGNTTSTKTGKTTSPKTGDQFLWITLLFTSCGAVACTVIIGKKKKNKMK